MAQAPETVVETPMRQVIQNVRTGDLSLRDVPAPALRPRHVLVRTEASLISAGTERMVTDFAAKSLAGKAKDRPDLVRKVIDKARRDGIGATLRAVTARLNEPLPLGYSAAGIVEQVGEGLEGVFHVGDRVAVAGAGVANHAELNVVPENLCAAVPDGVAPEDACYATVGAIALHAVRNADAALGETVAVLGAGLVGQLAARLLTLSGCRVCVLDPDAKRRDLALAQGAEWAFDPFDAGAADKLRAATRGLGADALVIAAATESAQPLEAAADLARDRARVVMVGMTGTAFPYPAFMKKELSIVVSRSYGPGRYDDDFERRGVKYPEGWVRWTETENMAECLRLMDPARGAAMRLDPSALTTHTLPLDDAERAYALLKDSDDAPLGLVLTYPKAAPEAARAPLPLAAAKPGACAVGLIGAGAYAASVLIPALKGLSGVTLQAVATPKGANAETMRANAGFAAAHTDAEAVLSDPAVTAVVIATRHADHAELTARALAAGKCVWVEKPLALDAAGVDAVEAARRTAPGFFTVGFNRRFAPTALRLRDALVRAAEPPVIVIRVNAGPLPRDHWTHAADDGGGRIVGEACHFVDLARFLAGSPVVSVSADAARAEDGPCDDVSVQMRFANGALATVVYTARGGRGLAKERVEVFSGGDAWVIDDFKSLSGPGRTSGLSGSADKGQTAALRAFADAVKAGGPAPVDEAELLETARAVLAVMDSLRAGAPVLLR
jgi:predicted dehydrogenase/threonine dehydrogenase-like Zn-dependent dehydrogenase